MNPADRILAAAQRKPVDCTPVWFMRQAGRCLAQYRELRERYDILEITRTPELCAQVTLMPIEACGVDAAVMYADIMLPLYGMGVPFSIDPGVGPIIHEPVRTRGDIDKLAIVDPEEGTPDLFQAIKMVRTALEGKQAVVGFAGGPFTLASYMLEGRPTKEFVQTKGMIYGAPEDWHALMGTLATVTTKYLLAQIAAGAQIIQLFDSWGGALGTERYEQDVLPYVAQIIRDVKAASDVPMIYFATGASHLYPTFSTLECEVISVDWRMPIDQAWKMIGDHHAIQGNLDPGAAAAPVAVALRETQRIVDLVGNHPGHIFNLGHGVFPETDPGVLREIVEHVHRKTAEAKTGLLEGAGIGGR